MTKKKIYKKIKIYKIRRWLGLPTGTSYPTLCIYCCVELGGLKCFDSVFLAYVSKMSDFSMQLTFGGMPYSGKPVSGGRRNFKGCMESINYNGENITDLARRKKLDTSSFVSRFPFQSTTRIISDWSEIDFDCITFSFMTVHMCIFNVWLVFAWRFLWRCMTMKRCARLTLQNV